MESLIDRSIVDSALTEATSRGADFAEVFVEDKVGTFAFLDDGRIEEVSSGRSRGAGIRVVVGESTGFAHTADLTEDGLRRAAQAAAAAARGANTGITRVALPDVVSGNRIEILSLPSEVDKADKVNVLLEANEVARAKSGSITQVSGSYADSRRSIMVANTEGIFASDEVVRTRFSVSCVASGDIGMQTGSESIGHTMGFEIFDLYDVAELAERAAERALVKLSARPAPSGSLPVVIASGGGGVLFHEACGHGLEADLIGKGASVFAGRIGEMVASPLVTVVDDATLGAEWGRFSIDDEGNPAGRHVLIENGMLTDYMWDILRARKEGRVASGNGRRESYEHLPMVRMTNTYLVGGNDNPEDIIASTEHGVYVKHLAGGQVNTTTGDFVFGMSEAYMIENGEITEPLREGNLIGNGPEVLANIDAVGDDFAMGPPGTCGKDGQGVPVGDGVPTLRVTKLTVGGTAT